MRPDLVARIYYGDIRKLDYILKFNGISNPFSLESGTILLIGEPSEIESNFVSSNSTNDSTQKSQDLRDKFFDKNRLSKKDAKRIDLVKQKSKQFQNAASNLPPNFAEQGSTELTVQNGIVIFGANAVPNNTNCPVVLSRAKVKAKLIENKIFQNI